MAMRDRFNCSVPRSAAKWALRVKLVSQETHAAIMLFSLASFTSPCKPITVFKQLGTLKHYKHFLLINEDIETACVHFMSFHVRPFGFLPLPSEASSRGDSRWSRNSAARMEGDWGSRPLPGSSFLHYFESAVLGVVISLNLR